MDHRNAMIKNAPSIMIEFSYSGLNEVSTQFFHACENKSFACVSNIWYFDIVVTCERCLEKSFHVRSQSLERDGRLARRGSFLFFATIDGRASRGCRHCSSRDQMLCNQILVSVRTAGGCTARVAE